MKTAMQEAIELVKKYDSRKISYNVLLGNLELLLEKEKEQIEKAFKNGLLDAWNNGTKWDYYEDHYYNQTYKQESIDAVSLLSDIVKEEVDKLNGQDRGKAASDYVDGVIMEEMIRIAKEIGPQDPAIDDMLEIEETDEEAAYRKGYMDGYDEGLYDGMYK